jgi:RNA polymerase sigma-70 factor (ECF subfamily)
MDESVHKGNQAEAFEHYRVLLFSIAYRMIGSASDAEDLVQETYLRYQASDSEEIVSLKAYLTTIITHLALNYLKSARVAREQYVGIWLPEPILTSEDGGFPQAALEHQEVLSLAFLRLLETLSPPERAVFLLHEIFDYPFSEIGAMLSKSPANCRQIFHRARQALEDKRARFDPEPQRQHQLLLSFLSASQAGDMAALTSFLAQDAVSWSDGGGKLRAPLRPIRGRSAVARYWAGMARKDQRLLELRMEEVNGQLAVVAWEGAALFAVIALMATQEGVQEMYAILNPEKLVYIQRQIEARQRTPQV